jgi:cell division protein YceG involved in septum cleavage
MSGAVAKRRRSLLVVLVVLAVVLVACGVFVLWPRQPLIKRENYKRIEAGMSRAEVQAILARQAILSAGQWKRSSLRARKNLMSRRTIRRQRIRKSQRNSGATQAG